MGAMVDSRLMGPSQVWSYEAWRTHLEGYQSFHFPSTDEVDVAKRMPPVAESFHWPLFWCGFVSHPSMRYGLRGHHFTAGLLRV